MAVEKAPDLFGGGLGGAGTADAVRAQARALEIEFESLSDYKKTVDGLLKTLDGSEANDKKLADGTLPAGTLGKGFAEADALFKSYHTVHDQLQSLSKGLAGQIEALGIAILSAGKGFTEMDEETKRRMAAIAKQARQDYVEDRDPLARQRKAEQQQAASGATNHTSKSKGNL